MYLVFIMQIAMILIRIRVLTHLLPSVQFRWRKEVSLGSRKD